MCKVSVIIPVFNTGEYLNKCLDNFINQTLKDIEIIAVDDGSTDDSLKILNKYAQKDCRIKVFHQKNSGAASARNRAISVAKGEYLYIIDSDDYCELNTLEKMYNKALSVNADICLCKVSFLNKKTGKSKILKNSLMLNLLPKEKEVFNRDDIAHNILQITSVAAFNKLFKREFIKNECISFQKISSCNDVFFNYSALILARKITYIDECFVTSVRNRKGSITSDRGGKIYNLLLAAKQTKDFLNQKGVFVQIQDSFYNRFIDNFYYEIKKCYKDDLRKDFIKDFKKFIPKKYHKECNKKISKIELKLKFRKFLNFFH